MSDPFLIRPARIADIGIIAYHRASMFRDMGAVRTERIDRLVEMTRAYLEDAMPRGE